MKKSRFDVLIENLTVIAEGRKKKTYSLETIDFDKLELDLNAMSDKNPFKRIYQHIVDGLKRISDNESFSNEEMADTAKTKPEWEQAIMAALSGEGLSKIEKASFTDRFYNFLKDPDRGYFSEYVDNSKNETVAAKNIEEHIFDYINQSDDETATVDEVVNYIARYGHDESEIKDSIENMVADGSLARNEDRLTALRDPELDELEPSDTDIDATDDTDGTEEFEDFSKDELEEDEPQSTEDRGGNPYHDEDEEESDHTRLPDDVAKELGIDADDPFGERDYAEANY